VGMLSKAPKKISDERRRNMRMKGLKIKFPRGENIERGSPQATRMGREKSVT